MARPRGPGTPQQDVLHQSFGGKIVHQIICKEPVTVGNRTFTVQDPYKSGREECFFALQLEDKHKRNILEALQLYVEGEVLGGDNNYMCEGSKVDAVKRVCMKELPKTLILHPNRFEFDLACIKRAKRRRQPCPLAADRPLARSLSSARQRCVP